MKSITDVLLFLWKNRVLIMTAIPLVKEAAHEFNTNPDKKFWVAGQLEVLKRFTPDDIDKGIDLVVQLLQWKGILK
jgi:hypothetical protein